MLFSTKFLINHLLFSRIALGDRKMKYGLSEDVYKKIKKVIDRNSKYKFLLFGSRARGNYKTTSDIDIAIKENVPKEDQYKIMNEIDLLDIIYKIDLVFIDENTKDELLESINRDGVEF
jgi:predicted nucleotidyltransferase